MQSVDRRLTAEVGLGEDRYEGAALYMKGAARAFVAESGGRAGFRMGSVVVAAAAATVEASHRPLGEYMWDPSIRFGLPWVCFRALAMFLAVVDTRHRQSHRGGNCYLEGLSTI